MIKDGFGQITWNNYDKMSRSDLVKGLPKQSDNFTHWGERWLDVLDCVEADTGSRPMVIGERLVKNDGLDAVYSDSYASIKSTASASVAEPETAPTAFGLETISW